MKLLQPIVQRYMAFLKVGMLLVFTSFLALNSLGLNNNFTLEAHPKLIGGHVKLESADAPVHPAIPQQPCTEDFLLLDGDDEDNELYFSNVLLSLFQYLNSYSSVTEPKVTRVLPHLSYIPLFLLFKSWKVFLF